MLLTHAHADHLSFDSLDRLPKDIPLYCATGGRAMASIGSAIATPSTDRPGRDRCAWATVTVHAGGATHRGNRYGFDRWRSAANMYSARRGTRRCFFAGDTALVEDTHHLVETHAVGRTGGSSIWRCCRSATRRGGSQAFAADISRTTTRSTLFERLRARMFVPYHWGTFRHVTATAHDAIRRLRERLESHHLARGRAHHRAGRVARLERDASLATPRTCRRPRQADSTRPRRSSPRRRRRVAARWPSFACRGRARTRSRVPRVDSWPDDATRTRLCRRLRRRDGEALDQVDRAFVTTRPRRSPARTRWRSSRTVDSWCQRRWSPH